MQDTSTGLIHPIDDLSQAAKDRAIPKREHQGPVFQKGEEIEIRGGRFRVQGISRKHLYLKSLPALASHSRDVAEGGGKG